EMLIVYTLRSASHVGRRTSTSERAAMRGALRRSDPPPSLSCSSAIAATVGNDYVTGHCVTTAVTVAGPVRIQRRRKMKRTLVSFTARGAFGAALCGLVAPAYAAKSIKVTMNLITVDGVGKSVGTITIKEGKDGVTLEPKLKDLPPRDHG